MAEPIELPCTNSICKSHMEEIKTDDCIFCNQRHDIKSDQVKLSESLSQTLATNLHLTEQEKRIKNEIEQLFAETNRLTEKLQNAEREADTFCYDHFANIMNAIDLQKEELKLKIDHIAESLINQVKDCKSKLEASLKLNAATKHLSADEIQQYMGNFQAAMRCVELDEKVLALLKTNLMGNSNTLTLKIYQIEHLRAKIKTCSIRTEKICLNSLVFGDLKLVAG